MNERVAQQLNRLLKHTDIVLAIGVLGILLVMILPVPAVLIDLLFALNLAISIAILLVSVYMGKPLEFSVFPSILLVTTLFRLSLNVASTRLILLSGHEGTAAAGHVIETFGNLVVGGSYVVGVVVFILLVIINFVVITKGSGRVAEVAARFILDAMPGKQMAIDADLNAGLINEEQARERRKKIESEADFYGAMDGASKFVRGDAIAGILITLVNVIGGLGVGVIQRGLGIGVALERYTLMTIGDGIVTQIPALVVSTAAGFIVTRAASGNDYSKDVARQILMQPRAIGITAVILALLGLVPGLPKIPFFLLASFLGGVSWVVRDHERQAASQDAKEEEKRVQLVSQDTTIPPEVGILELKVGYGLVDLVEGDKAGDLVERIYGIRREFAKELGIIVPRVTIKDDLELSPNQYTLLVKGVPVGGGELMASHVLAMDPGTVRAPVEGLETQEPVFNLASLWVADANKEKAQAAGYTVVDHSTIIATHLSETIRRHAAELIGRQELQGLVDNLAKTHPKVVEELIPTVLPLGTVLKVCQNLLREQVPVRDLLTILETLANHGASQKDPDVLTEFVRSSLARTITNRLAPGVQELEVMTLDSRAEEVLIRSYQKTEAGVQLNLDRDFFQKLVSSIQKVLEDTVFSSGIPVLICHPLIRGQLRKLLERFTPALNIITANEVAASARLKTLARVEV